MVGDQRKGSRNGILTSGDVVLIGLLRLGMWDARNSRKYGRAVRRCKVPLCKKKIVGRVYSII